LIQNGINIGDRIVAIGVSDKMCESCAADVKKYNIKTVNGEYKPGEYKRLPDNRPGQQRVRFDKRPKKKKC
jgi:copper chaperone CopZ